MNWRCSIINNNRCVLRGIGGLNGVSPDRHRRRGAGMMYTPGVNGTRRDLGLFPNDKNTICYEYERLVIVNTKKEIEL